MLNRNHRHQERGEGRVKLLLTLALLAAAAYLGMQFIPIYMRSLQMQDETEKIVRLAAFQNLRDADVRARLEEKAIEYQLPDNKRIEVICQGKKVTARVAYTHTIALPFYTYTWPFEFRKEESRF
jgi:hypothetical protein